MKNAPSPLQVLLNVDTVAGLLQETLKKNAMCIIVAGITNKNAPINTSVKKPSKYNLNTSWQAYE